MEREGAGAVSPVTKEVFLSDDVYPCGHFLDTIKHLVDTGVIDSKLADPWKVRLGEHEEMVAKMKSNAESGDVSAMYCLGEWYWNGLEGFKEDKGEAYNWYTKASDRRFPKAMARVGQCLLNGSAGATTNTIEGIVLLALAAERGSDKACFLLGETYYHGRHGIGKNEEEAKHLLEKALAKDECEYNHLEDEEANEARAMLDEMEGKGWDR